VAESLRELMDLEGRVAVITGGAGHIGSVMGDALAELGASVILLDVSHEQCIEAAQRIHATYGVKALAHLVDLNDAEAVRSVPEFADRHFGRLDVLINCAAMVGSVDLEGWVSAFEEQDVAIWRNALEINLTAPFVLTQACAKLLAASGHGSIINVSSIYGMVGPDWRLYAETTMGNPAAYGASKGGGAAPIDSLAGYNPGAKDSRQCDHSRRRFIVIRKSLSLTVHSPHAARPDGYRNGFQGRCGLPCNQPFSLCDWTESGC